MSKPNIIAEARAQDCPQMLADQIPFAKAMGITFAREDDLVLGQMAFDQHLIGDIGIAALHGGAIGTLLESTAIFTLLWEVERTKIPKTISLTVEYLRSGRPKPTYASAQITRLGRRVAAVRAIAWQSDRDKPIAAAYANFLLVPL